MEATKRLLLGLVVTMWTSVKAFADDAVQTAATTQFNIAAEWIVGIICGPIGKVVAAFFLLIGIGNLIKKEVGGALMCGIAFLILIFMPQILSVFPKGN